ncbi:hypothetical protein GXW82_42375 [Streptacidiphilus sp. 4-A2]|nr:hypothetical protein [Streptacidiphilus sp. 4-A2]
MTVYGHQRPAGALGRRRGVVTGAVLAAVSASWAFAAMAAVAALGAHLLGLDRYAALGPVTAALVALAVGGTVTPSGQLSLLGLGTANGQGAVGIMPLGVSFVGALVLGLLFVRPLRRLPVLDPPVLLARIGGVLAAYLVLLWVVAWSGNGTVTIELNSLIGSGGGSGSGGGLLGGLSGLLGSALGAGHPEVGFRVELLPTLGLGLLWALVVLAIALTASRRVPLPHQQRLLRQAVRPAVSAVVTTVVVAVLAGAVSGTVVGLRGHGGARTIGGVLLGTPNGVFLGVPLGMGLPLDGKATGPLAGLLPAPVNQLLKGGSGQSITLSRLAAQDGRVWLLPVAVALLLLAAGVLTAARTPGPARPESALREAAGTGLRLGVALAATVPLLLALGQVSVGANLSVFGFSAVGAELDVSGNLALGAALGLVEGAVFGLLGGLLMRRFGSTDARPAQPAPANPTGPANPAGPTSPTSPADPADRYQALPEQPPRTVTDLPANPYAAPPPQTNPYSGGPARKPPPPPVPPER